MRDGSGAEAQQDDADTGAPGAAMWPGAHSANSLQTLIFSLILAGS